MYRTSAERRHNDVVKALRKRNICRNFYGWEYYDNLHQYSKNKIHCSCPICAAKTNMPKYRHGGKCEGMNYTPRDMRVWEAMTQAIKEFEHGEEYEETAA